METEDILSDNNIAPRGIVVVLLEDVYMRKSLFSIVLTFILAVFFVMIPDFDSILVQAKGTLNNGITIEDEYLIPDSIGWSTYYVVVARNDTGVDVQISADFQAKDAGGNLLKKVNDYSEAVKAGQKFMLYGQFLNTVVENATAYEYTYNVEPTNKCAYNSVSLETEKTDDHILVSAVNSSKFATESVGVRAVFIKDGKAVAFDKVNIADNGVTFFAGSNNHQVIGTNVGSYDEMIITYTTASNVALADV